MPEFGTRALVFRLGSTDYSDAVNKCRVRSGDSDADFVSFAQAAAGGARKYQLVFNLKQDSAAASLWSYAWLQSGQTVAYEVWPAGRPVSGAATISQPKFTGSVVVMEPDGDFIGGDADASPTKVFQSEFVWDCTGKPVLGTS